MWAAANQRKVGSSDLLQRKNLSVGETDCNPGPEPKEAEDPRRIDRVAKFFVCTNQGVTAVAPEWVYEEMRRRSQNLSRWIPNSLLEEPARPVFTFSDYDVLRPYVTGTMADMRLLLEGHSVETAQFHVPFSFGLQWETPNHPAVRRELSFGTTIGEAMTAFGLVPPSRAHSRASAPSRIQWRRVREGHGVDIADCGPDMAGEDLLAPTQVLLPSLRWPDLTDEELAAALGSIRRTSVSNEEVLRRVAEEFGYPPDLIQFASCRQGSRMITVGIAQGHMRTITF